MTLTIRCYKCGGELENFGAIIFSPPMGALVTKYHICRTCFDQLEHKWLNKADTNLQEAEAFDPDAWVCRDCEAGEPHTCLRYGKLKNQERRKANPQEADNG